MATRESGKAQGGELEERADLSAETTAKLAQCEQLLQSGQLTEALQLLTALEKRCRVGNDNASLIRVCEAAVKACYEANDYEALLSTLKTLATRRSQKTTAIKALVQTAMPWCVQEPYTPLPVAGKEEEEKRNQLVDALRELTDGKIFLERERAQLTRVWATLQENAGDIHKASTVLQEVHVETYGSLSKREKIEFILEQMRLTLAAQDFVRAAIVSGKVSRKFLAEENMQDYKVRFFSLLTVSHRHDKDALALAKDYHAIYSTPSTLQDESQWMEALQATVLFLVLSPFSNEQQDMLHRVSTDSNLEKLPACQFTINLFLKKEIINYPTLHQQEVESLSAFTEGDLGAHWNKVFFRSIIQHNVRVVSIYYKRIHGSRLAQLLQLDRSQLEQEIAGMVSDGSIYAKIDRPADIVRFCPPSNPEAILSDWAGDIDELLHLVETTTHLIHKEYMTT